MCLSNQLRLAIIQSIENALKNLEKIQQENSNKLKKLWKFEHEFDFMYGQVVGWVGGYANGLFFIENSRQPSQQEYFEINKIIEEHAVKIRKKINKLRK